MDIQPFYRTIFLSFIISKSRLSKTHYLDFQCKLNQDLSKMCSNPQQNESCRNSHTHLAQRQKGNSDFGRCLSARLLQSEAKYCWSRMPSKWSYIRQWEGCRYLYDYAETVWFLRSGQKMLSSAHVYTIRTAAVEHQQNTVHWMRGLMLAGCPLCIHPVLVLVHKQFSIRTHGRTKILFH